MARQHRLYGEPLTGTCGSGRPDTVPGVQISAEQLETFRRWALGNLVENRNRGLFAEWLIGTALGIADDSGSADSALFKIENTDASQSH